MKFNFIFNSSQNNSFGAFERHTIGIKSKLLMKMGYEGKGLGTHAQGIVEPIVVEERPRYLCLGYEQHDVELSKAKEAHEGLTRRNFITCSYPQACEDCVHEECKSCITTLKEDAHKHETSEKGKQENDASSRLLTPWLVFQIEPLPLQIHLLKKEKKVNVQDINLPLIKFLLIMINMVNLHTRFGENIHVPFVV